VADLGMMPAAPATRLATFRILSGAFAVGYLVLRLPYLLDVIRLDRSHWDPPGVLSVLRDAPGQGLAQIVLALTVATGIAFTLGWRYRVMGPAFAMLLLATLTYRNSWGHLFHSDDLLVLHVLVVGFVPAADRWSLDARRAGHAAADGAPSVRYGWPLRLAALVTVLTYVVTGVAKLRYAGTGWLGGDTLLHQVAFDNARKKVLGAPYSPLASTAAAHPGLFRPMGPVTLAIELAAPIALVGRRWATGWTAAAWVLHVGILALMAIGFPYPLSLVAFAPFFRAELPIERLLARTKGRRLVR
jgi:hypothetical protein